METSLIGTLTFTVRKDLHIKYPRAETPTHYISMGFDDDLSIAAHKAVREMVDFLVAVKHLSRDDAYMLTSVAGDVVSAPANTARAWSSPSSASGTSSDRTVDQT